MFQLVVTVVYRSGLLVDKELSLVCAVLEPIETNVDQLSLLLFDGVVCESSTYIVVYLYGSTWLGWPSSWSLVRIGTVSVAVKKAAAISYSIMELIKFLNIFIL